SEDPSRVGEDLAALDGFGEPDRAVAERLDLGHGLALLGGGQRLEREAPGADAPQQLAQLVALPTQLALGFLLHGAGPYQRGRGPRTGAPVLSDAATIRRRPAHRRAPPGGAARAPAPPRRLRRGASATTPALPAATYCVGPTAHS